jgi:cell division transport system permease protein
MRALRYAFREAAKSLWRGRRSALVAALAGSLAMLVLGAFLLVTANLDNLLARWMSVAEFSVYLRDDASSDQQQAIEAAIDRSGVAARRDYVSKPQALSRFRREFADLAPLVDDVDDNPFPASFEVQVLPDVAATGQARTVVAQLLTLPGVADVRYDDEWLARLTAAVATLRSLGLALAFVMAIAAALTVASAVRLGLHSRRDELAIMQLTGSPLAFIRGPFIAEGVIQGGLGSLLALAVLWLGFAAAVARWGTTVSAMLDGASVAFLSPGAVAVLIAGGMAVGALGGFMASRHAA